VRAARPPQPMGLMIVAVAREVITDTEE